MENINTVYVLVAQRLYLQGVLWLCIIIIIKIKIETYL